MTNSIGRFCLQGFLGFSLLCFCFQLFEFYQFPLQQPTAILELNYTPKFITKKIEIWPRKMNKIQFPEDIPVFSL